MKDTSLVIFTTSNIIWITFLVLNFNTIVKFLLIEDKENLVISKIGKVSRGK